MGTHVPRARPSPPSIPYRPSNATNFRIPGHLTCNAVSLTNGDPLRLSPDKCLDQGPVPQAWRATKSLEDHGFPFSRDLWPGPCAPSSPGLSCVRVPRPQVGLWRDPCGLAEQVLAQLGTSTISGGEGICSSEPPRRTGAGLSLLAVHQQISREAIRMKCRWTVHVTSLWPTQHLCGLLVADPGDQPRERQPGTTRDSAEGCWMQPGPPSRGERRCPRPPHAPPSRRDPASGCRDPRCRLQVSSRAPALSRSGADYPPS